MKYPQTKEEGWSMKFIETRQIGKLKEYLSSRFGLSSADIRTFLFGTPLPLSACDPIDRTFIQASFESNETTVKFEKATVPGETTGDCWMILLETPDVEKLRQYLQTTWLSKEEIEAFLQKRRVAVPHATMSDRAHMEWLFASQANTLIATSGPAE